MSGDLLEATEALTLSSPKARSGILLINPNARSMSRSPFKVSHHQNRVLATRRHEDDDEDLSQKSTFGTSQSSTGAETRLSKTLSMPRGTKRRAEMSDDAEAKATKDTPKPSKLARRIEEPGSTSREPIEISDSDDEDDKPLAALQNLANRYTYESPTKAHSKSRAGATRLKTEASTLKDVLDAPTLPIASSSAKKLENAIKDDSTTSKSTKKAQSKTRKPSKATKATVRATINLKATIARAEAEGISPFDLSRVDAAGFRLISSCSFCAASFTKSAAAKVKQEHMSLCAPLSGVLESASAVDTIKSDIRKSMERLKEDERKAREQRTVFQEMVQEADIVRHEGRASQIAASPKKRGKDSVITKKAVKRTAKPLLLDNDGLFNGIGGGSASAAHPFMPASKARQIAREVANQLLGLLPTSARSSTVADDYKSDAKADTLDEPPTTPKKSRKRSFTAFKRADLATIDCTVDETNHLPIVSAEQVFASLASSSSPQKSPVKALQRSRERQASRDGDIGAALEGESSSPSLPQTQPFAPSKLAQRRRAGDGDYPKGLFGAQTTSRSLLDLVKKQYNAEASEDSRVSICKADKVDAAALNGHAKRDASSVRVLETQKESAGLDSAHNIRQVKPGEKRCIIDPDPLGSDMDVDERIVDTLLPSQSSDQGISQTGKLQARDGRNSRLGSASASAFAHDTNRLASPHLRQYAAHELVDLDTDITEDEESDTQSFLELLEPLDPHPEPVRSPISDASDLTERESEEPSPRELSLRRLRTFFAGGGDSVPISKLRRAPSDTSLISLDEPTQIDVDEGGSVVPDSEPELALLTDVSSSASSPRL